LLLATAQQGGPEVVDVGRVSAVFWPGGESIATALAEMADQPRDWPGIADSSTAPIRLVFADTRERFDSMTGGRMPSWTAAATFPATRTIVLQRTPELPRVLRHELAHLALHTVVRRVPRWFDEGYAAYAAGEWDRLEALRVNLALLRRSAPTLADLDRAIREGGASQAEASYAMATTAVLLLERLGRGQGLAPLLRNLQRTADFDLALRATYQLTSLQFEEQWQHELRRRYGWLFVLSSLTLFWAFAGLLLVVLWARRRKLTRGRRAALDEGWSVPEEQWNIDS